MTVNEQIAKAAAIIRKGGIVAFPTETVYGLGANALDPLAVAKIFAKKERPSFDPLIVHICNTNEISRLSSVNDERVLALAQQFWPGPLTIVVPKSDIVPDIVSSGLPTVGLRMPNNIIALQLIETAGCPIAAPSANKFGKLSPTCAEHVKKQLPDLEYILDGGCTNIGVESTVITLNDDGFFILRHGAITQSDLEEILPQSKKTYTDTVKPASPGLMNSHYSPEKPIYILGVHTIVKDIENAGLISFSGKNTHGYKMVEVLSASADLNEAATHFFSAMHRLEEADIEFIVAESVPETGIGIAIMDRLRKASYRFHI